MSQRTVCWYRSSHLVCCRFMLTRVRERERERERVCVCEEGTRCLVVAVFCYSFHGSLQHQYSLLASWPVVAIGTTLRALCFAVWIPAGARDLLWIVEEWKTNFMSLAILFHFLCAQHVSDINISIIRSMRLCCWITTSVVLFSVRCVLEI